MKLQKGFAVVEGLLILIIVAMLAGTGYYIWHANQNTKKILDKTQEDNLALSSTKKSGSATSQKTLTIKEWGVEGTYTSSVDLIYKTTSDNLGEVWAQMSSSQLLASNPTRCSIDSQLGGVITRVKTGEQLRSPAGDETGQTVEQAVKAGTLSEYSHVGDYYYYYEHPQAVCGTSETDPSVALQTKTLDAVKAAAKNLQQIK